MLVERRRQRYAIWEPDLRRELRAARVAARDLREICGLLVDVGPAIRLRPTKNQSRRQGSFEISLREIHRVERSADVVDVGVVGTYHSHFFGDPMPGKRDVSTAPDGSLMLILQPFRRTAGLWWIQNGRVRRVSLEALADSTKKGGKSLRTLGLGRDYEVRGRKLKPI